MNLMHLGTAAQECTDCPHRHIAWQKHSNSCREEAGTHFTCCCCSNHAAAAACQPDACLPKSQTRYKTLITDKIRDSLRPVCFVLVCLQHVNTSSTMMTCCHMLREKRILGHLSARILALRSSSWRIWASRCSSAFLFAFCSCASSASSCACTQGP